MLTRLKSFIAGMVFMLILVSVTAFADDVSGMISAAVNSVKIIINGTLKEIDTITYNDRVYIQLRSVSDIFEKDVSWDDNDNAVHINDRPKIAYVNGAAISDVKFLEYYEKILAERGGKIDMTEEAFREKVLDTIIEEELVLQEADANRIYFEDYDQKRIDEHIETMQQMCGGEEKFLEYLKEDGLTMNSYIKSLKRQFVFDKFYAFLAEPTREAITDEQILKFYKSHKQDFKAELLRAKHILIKTTYEDGSEVDDSEKERLFNLANDIYYKILAGEDFDKVMKQYSDDNAKDVNAEGYIFGKGETVKVFEDAAFALKPGEVSEIIKSYLGYHIIKLEEKLDYKPLDMVKEQIITEIVNKEIAAEMQRWKDGSRITRNFDVLYALKIEEN